MKKLLLALSLLCGIAHADTTANLINNNNWSGVGAYAADPNDCCSNPAGSLPLYDTATNTIKFSYGQATVSQTWAINNALSSVGAGVQVGGYNWSYDLRNLNGSGGQNGTDTITSYSYLLDLNGTPILSNTLTHNTQFDWTTFSGTQTLNSPLTTNGTLGIQFTGKDGGFWAGLYGPEVRNVSMSLNYTVDPCVANPRSSPSCPGYNTVWDSGNLTNIYGTAFAVNQALGFGNSGVQVHSAIVGFDYNINGQYCSGGWALGICFGWSDSKVRGQWNVLDPNGTIITYDDKTISGQNISGTYRNEVLIGRDISTIGNTSITTSRTGNASTSNPYIGFTFSPDQACLNNPLVNAQCPGYQQAYFTQQCTLNALYDTQCPGYAQAYYNQQCSINALYDPGCPGYASAYLDYQCNLNQLYSTSCPGYAQAYHDQQCSLNPLYATDCAGYQTAVTECSANPLTHTYCPSYQTAVTDCSTNGLTHSYCPSYALEQQLCSSDPLSNTLCSGYATATLECNSNQLLHPYCPAYKTALASCSTDPQSNTMCPGYSTTKTTVALSSDLPTVSASTGDATVDAVINTETTSTTSPTATVQLAPAATTTTTTAVTQTTTTEETKTETTASKSSTDNSATQTASTADSKTTKPTLRQQIAAKRKEAAMKSAVVAGKEAAENMESATSMESQVAVQNVVIAAMGFTPGFNAYSYIMPDGVGYKPFAIYKNQRNVDNARLTRGLTGASERLHEEMVAAQYKLGE